MMGRTFGYILLLLVGCYAHAQSPQDSACDASTVSYRVITIQDYSFNEVLNEGIETLARQLDVLNIPIRPARIVIKEHIRQHAFSMNWWKRQRAIFRAISFAYPSVSPQGDSIMLSGLVTIPVLKGNTPQRMLVYHRLTCTSNRIAPSNSLPIEAVLSADNTICVFPDYYGCGVTEGQPLPFVALNYHARCATDCVLAALDIVRDNGIVLDTGFYTWNTGFSQGAGYALAMHKYIENTLPDSLSRRINLRWTLCYSGVYSPLALYEAALSSGDMGSTPSVYLQSLRGLFVAHGDWMDGLTIRDYLSDKALESKMDSILLTDDDGLWDLADRLDGRDESHDPADYFTPEALDTATTLYKRMASAFSLDDCGAGWQPQAMVVLCHSKDDNAIPFGLTAQTQKQIGEPDGNVLLCTPSYNRSHFYTGYLYFYTLLRYREDVLYKRHIRSGRMNVAVSRF